MKTPFKVSEETLIAGLMERYDALHKVSNYADVNICINGRADGTPTIRCMAYTGCDPTYGRSLDSCFRAEIRKHQDERISEAEKLREHAASLLKKANELSPDPFPPESAAGPATPEAGPVAKL